MSPLTLGWLAALSVMLCWLVSSASSSDNPPGAPLLNRSGKLEDKEELFVRLNREYREMNEVSAALTWSSMVGEGDGNGDGEELMESHTEWHNNWCNDLMGRKVDFDSLTSSQKRQVYLLCRGPKYTPSQSRELMAVLGQLEDSYVSTKVCQGLGSCYDVEPELQALMKNS